jgi:hypothetical protein
MAQKRGYSEGILVVENLVPQVMTMLREAPKKNKDTFKKENVHTALDFFQ